MSIVGCVGVRLCSWKRDKAAGKHACKRKRWILLRVSAERRFHIGEPYTSNGISILIALRNLDYRFGQMTWRTQDCRIIFGLLEWHETAFRRFGSVRNPVFQMQ